MSNRRTNHLIIFALTCLVASFTQAEDKDKMPREDVIDVPAIGEGLCVHNLFQSNMVLQRDKPIKIWGWANPGEMVTVSFGESEQSGKTGEDRCWKVTLPAMEACSTPAKLTVKGKDKTLTLDNILIGDVWILGGQSNMEAPIQNVENGRLEIVSANYTGIRILTLPKKQGPIEQKAFPRLHEWSSWSGRHFRKGDWDVCSPEIVRDLSAIGYVFAKRIHMASQIPIGVIDASWGGTTVETWTPISVLRKMDSKEVKSMLAEWDQKAAEWDPKEDLKRRVDNHNKWVENMKKKGEKIPESRKVPTDLRPGPRESKHHPGNCYAGVIGPISGLAVKGAIFHQGFNNALGFGSEHSERYYQIFGKMITAWRAAFDDPEMPFGIISLCTAGDPQTRDDYLEKMIDLGVYIREAQYRVFLDFYKAGDQNIGFASSFDKRRYNYHPPLKIPVGERIARWALATQYGFEKEIAWKPPMIKEMKVEDGKIILRMDTSVRPVDQRSTGPISGFAIAGEDRRFQPADGTFLETGKDSRNRPKYDNRAIVLSSPHVHRPIHFRYAWARNPMGNLQSATNDDLPFATQRSDNWKMEEVPTKLPVDEKRTLQEQARRLKGECQKELRLDDLGRRLKEAQMLIDEHREAYENEQAARTVSTQ